jgi:KpsF/GutQ family protein
MNILDEVHKVFSTEINGLKKVEKSLDQSIIDVIQAINTCKGKTILCGIGKSGHIAQKISSTMSSIGIPSHILHPSEALHGDLGCLTKDDIIIMISNSGETSEICSLLPNLRVMNIPIIAITSNANSVLAEYSDYKIILPKLKEAGTLGLAPTSSTTATLVIGDAIAVVVSKLRNFKEENFALYHPAGSLGHKLITKVDDVIYDKENTPKILIHSKMTEAIIIMCRTGMGAILVVNHQDILQGIITDGDLKRYLKDGIDLNCILVNDVMTTNPICIQSGDLAVNALKLMENRKEKIHVVPVIDSSRKVIGLVRNHDVINAGIFL